MARKILNDFGSRISIIATGGVYDGKSAYIKILCGADLIQLYTGMVYEGPLVIKNILDIKKVLYSPRSFYTCHSRFLSIYELLKKNYNVLSLDVDTIALKNFDDVFNLKNDILTVKSESNNDIFSNEGFLLFKNTEINKTYIHKIVNYIFTEKNFIDWNADHYALHKFKPNNVNVYLLDEKYKDRKHLNNSIMWTGDANNKYNEKFTLHMEK